MHIYKQLRIIVNPAWDEQHSWSAWETTSMNSVILKYIELNLCVVVAESHTHHLLEHWPMPDVLISNLFLKQHIKLKEDWGIHTDHVYFNLKYVSEWKN